MKKACGFVLALLLLFFGCRPKKESLYAIGIFQINEAPTLNAVRKGFVQALEENGLSDGVNVRLLVRIAMGDIPEAQRIAREFAHRPVNMLVPFSTPCLQAALHATKDIPIVFSSVANPMLAGAGRSFEDHLDHVSGVSSGGPILESLVFIKQVLPDIKRIGTLWTPSELNSEYYLDLAREGAAELGMEVVAVPVENSSDVLHSAQVLISKQIEAIYQISDNTINAAFEALGRVAEENAIPLFGGYPPHTRLGAAAAMGWDFFDMGFKAGQIAVRIKNGEHPGSIPFQSMDKVILHLNLDAAQKQGIHFPESVLERADEIIGTRQSLSSPSWTP